MMQKKLTTVLWHENSVTPVNAQHWRKLKECLVCASFMGRGEGDLQPKRRVYKDSEEQVLTFALGKHNGLPGS
jgi:hypothetical protein